MRALCTVLATLAACARPPSPPVPSRSPAPPASVAPLVPPAPPASLECSPRLEDGRESHALAQREYDRATALATGSPVLAAHVFEAIPRLFVDLSDTAQPTFDPDFARRVAVWPRVNGKVAFSRALLGRVRALARVVDTSDVMDAKANSLVMLASLGPAEIAPYVSSPEEPGPAPPVSLLHDTTLAALAGSSLFLNHGGARDFLSRAVSSPATDDEAVLLWPAASAVVRQLGVKEAPAIALLLKGWLADVRRRLASPPSATSASASAPAPASVRLVADRLFLLGQSAPRFKLQVEARQLADEILAKKGELPLVRGQRDWARAVHAAAAAMRFDLDHPNEGIARASRLYLVDERDHDEWRSLLYAERPGRPTDAARAARARDLEAESAAARFDTARCYLLAERAYATAPAEAERHFDALLAPVLDGPHVDLRSRGDRLCRLGAALSMREVPEARRVAVLLRVLRDPEPVLGPPCGGYVVRTSAEDRAELLFSLLSDHAAWLDTSVELRDWLFANGDGPAFDSWGYRAYERLFARALAHATGLEAEALAVKRLLTRWLEVVSTDPQGSALFAHEHILPLVGAHAATYGLRDEARRVFSSARPGASENVTLILGRARAAAIALNDL